jgi:hypothetical protein
LNTNTIKLLSIPLTLALPRNFPKSFPALSPQAMVQIQKLAVDSEVFEFVLLLDEKVQKKFLENFSGGPK